MGWPVFITYGTGFVEKFSSWKPNPSVRDKRERLFTTGSIPWFYRRDMSKLKPSLNGELPLP